MKLCRINIILREYENSWLNLTHKVLIVSYCGTKVLL